MLFFLSVCVPSHLTPADDTLSDRTQLMQQMQAAGAGGGAGGDEGEGEDSDDEGRLTPP